MADILPFRGVRYDAARVGNDLSAVMAPPYDVISPDEQAALYERHPSNVIRLILGREQDRYASAAQTFRAWQGHGAVKADPKPAIYVYRQTFDDPATGEPAPERLGIVCLLKLEDYSSGKVLPHENTLTAAKSDRLNLLRATQAQFESIYGLYSDPGLTVESFIKSLGALETVISGVDGLIGSTHTIDRITDPQSIATLAELLRDNPIFIADGHHRYETSLNYRREIREGIDAPDGAIPADYILITLTAFEDKGLLVLPTHRMVHNVDAARIEALTQNLGKHFDLQPVAGTSELENALLNAESAGRKVIGMAAPGGSLTLLTLRHPVESISEIVPGPESQAAKQLDVAILQKLVLEECLGINASSLAAGTNVGYTRDTDHAIEAVARGDEQLAFILARPTVEEVRQVSIAGDKMPQKSTFFFPKLLSGLVMRDLRTDNIEEQQEIASK
jgi:uncharacterized protein (DUF1015 family)